MPENLVSAALAYAREGWPVFPCRRDKKPLTAHSFKDATTSERTIKKWWNRWPNASIGYPTGPTLVIDVDGPDGETTLEALEAKYGSLPATSATQTGRGRHLYLAGNGTAIQSSAGKLGPHLDIRAQGGYVILPPSVHPNGARYQWIHRCDPAPLPDWLAALLAESRPGQNGDAGPARKIKEGQRNNHLTRRAGAMRRAGMSAAAISAALIVENQEQCDPLLPEVEVKRIAASVARYQCEAAATASQPAAIWEAEGLETFLESDIDGAEFFDPNKRMLARASVTEMFSPRGLGKSLYGLWLGVQLARGGLRILLIDRDNPRHVVRARLRGFETEVSIQLKVITREKCPPLTNAPAWAAFPLCRLRRYHP
jgi:Bifunctional DNA primase/polymerase, N-terminal/Primase C terminal 1 (PriCT-1)